jgi:hypothetical protein
LVKTGRVVNNGITGIDFTHLATHDSTVIIGTFSDGVYVSNDLGQTWMNTYFSGKHNPECWLPR